MKPRQHSLRMPTRWAGGSARKATMAAMWRSLRPEGLPPLFSSIRFRLTLWYVAILALVLLVFGGVVYAAQARGIRAEAYDQLRGQGQQLAATFDPGDGQIHPADPRPLGKIPPATP